MHSYVYIFFSLSTQLLFFTELIEAFSIMGQTTDLIKEAYTNEKELRLLGELKVLEKNICDTKKYLQINLKSKQGTDASTGNKSELDQISDELETYQYKISGFIEANFSNQIKIAGSFYCPRLYRQYNPKLDPSYPNWSFRFSRECVTDN